MKENQASFTAMLVAYMRAYHTKYSTDIIFDDFLAYDLIPEDKREQIEHILTSWDEQLNDSMDNEPSFDYPNTSKYFGQGISNVVSRARYTEDTLEKAIRQGVKQYVILGAGMDTFAFRRPDLMEKLKVFEVDHPATQEFKLKRLAELEWKHPANLHFIPVDFTKEKLETALTSSLYYDPGAKTLFSWFGVTPYLTKEEVLTVLHSIANISHSGSAVVFDYIDKEASISKEKSYRVQKSLEFLEKIGEPIKTGGFDPSGLYKDLECLGFHLEENLSPEDIDRCYLKGSKDKDHAFEYVHFACAVVE
jgi:methyltransferase (TIGR00027 family)